MNKIYRCLNLAKISLGKSVIEINPNLFKEYEKKDNDFYTFGVKNTNDIPRELIGKLRNNKRYLWTTIDKMSHIGRSIDVDLINPLTYRVMTGSTSGGPINILNGINDFCIGTDGGGSVLAPALSCNLYSIMCAGINLNINKDSISTDKFKFTPSVGVIGNNINILKEVVRDIKNLDLEEYNKDSIKIVIPQENNLTLPDGRDMYRLLHEVILNIDRNIEIIKYNFKDIYNRNIAIEEINTIFNNNIGDIILTFEGPIDMYGYDETIQRSFQGIVEKKITSNGGKAIVKAANICNCTAITVPSSSLASGFVICANKGIDNAKKAYYIAKLIDNLIEVPEIFERYFINKVKYVEPLKFD